MEKANDKSKVLIKDVEHVLIKFASGNKYNFYISNDNKVYTDGLYITKPIKMDTNLPVKTFLGFFKRTSRDSAEILWWFKK